MTDKAIKYLFSLFHFIIRSSVSLLTYCKLKFKDVSSQWAYPEYLQFDLITRQEFIFMSTIEVELSRTCLFHDASMIEIFILGVIGISMEVVIAICIQ